MTDVLWRSSLVEDAKVSEFAKKLNIPKKVARWLFLRGIESVDEARTWLNAAKPWTPPTSFFKLEKAVHSILAAVSAHKRIAIVGDYDVDGITSSAIMATTLRALAADFVCIIPHRIQDGYGLSNQLVDKATAQGASLIITVDNGIRATEAIRYAVSQGVEVIVTDHHEPGEEMPEGPLAIVHWLFHKTPEEAKLLSGAGVAWKLCSHLIQSSLMIDSEKNRLAQIHLGFAALGALADIMPLCGENRRLVREGIRALQNLSSPGWLALCDIAHVERNKLNANTLLWRITPRLNAAGRMDTAKIAYDLLMAEDEEQAVGLAQKVEFCNEVRRTETEKAANEAKEQWLAFSAEQNKLNAVVVSGPWSLGIVGIVANKLVESFSLPAIVFSDTGEQILRGSGRAPEGFSLYNALLECEPFLDHFGGHDSAIGCGVLRTGLEEFRSAFAEVAAGMLDTEISNLSLTDPVADDYLPLSLVTLETVDWVERFEPFGPHNPEFLFYIGPVELKQINTLQGGKHIRLLVAEGSVTAELVWFHPPDQVSSWQPGQMCGLTAKLSANVWRGVRRPQLIVQDGWILDNPLSRSDFAIVYRYIHRTGSLTLEDCEKLTKKHHIQDIQSLMSVFVELGFARLTGSAYHVVDEVTPNDLRESKAYQIHMRSCHKYVGEAENMKE